MRFFLDGRFFRYAVGAILCFFAVVLPYRARTRYNLVLSFVVHTPFVLFGMVARALLRRLDLLPEVPREGR